MFKSFFAKSRSMKVGFTLIELLVVIAIIGVLASIVLASLNTARRKSRDARRISDIKQIQLALELFFDAQPTVTYPVGQVIGAGCTTLFYGLNVLQTGGFMPQIPLDPNNATPDNCYRYVTPGTATPQSTYHLGAKLEDGANNVFGSDKDCNSGVIDSCTITGAVYGGGNSFNGTTDTTNRYYDVIP